MKESFADIAEKLGKKQAKYEKMLDSKDYRERNTGQLMLQRVQQRLNELKELQEEIKASKAIKTGKTGEYLNEGKPKMAYGGNPWDPPFGVKLHEYDGVPASIQAINSNYLGTPISGTPYKDTSGMPISHTNDFRYSDDPEFSYDERTMYSENNAGRAINAIDYMNNRISEMDNRFLNNLLAEDDANIEEAYIEDEQQIANRVKGIKYGMNKTVPQIANTGFKSASPKKMNPISVSPSFTPEKTKVGKGLEWLGENASTISSLANTFGGFLANKKAIDSSNAPIKPVTTPNINLSGTLDTTKEYRELNRGYNYGVTQAEQLGSTQAELAAKLGFTSARNRSVSEMEAKAANYRGQVKNQEAQINAQINQSNAQTVNSYLQQKMDYFNQKGQAKASNVNNLLGNISSTMLDLQANKDDLAKYDLLLAGMDADSASLVIDKLNIPDKVKKELKEKYSKKK